MMTGLILALTIALAPLALPAVTNTRGVAGLPTVRIGSGCTTLGELARSGRILLGCRAQQGALRWVRTAARIAPIIRRAMRTTITTAEATQEQRTALVINGMIAGITLGDIEVGRGARALTLDLRDPAQLGEAAGTNRYVLDDAVARSEPLTSRGCIASNCGIDVRNYALLRGSEVLNVIVWDGQPLLGSGTPIVAGITVMERRAGEPLGPGSRVLTATGTPLTPVGPVERRAIIEGSRVIAIVDGTSLLSLPAGVSAVSIDDAVAVEPDWIVHADGSFVDPEAEQNESSGGGASETTPNGGASSPPPAVELTPAPTPQPWRPGSDRLGAPLGGAGDYAIIVNGVVTNVIVLDPQSAGGQSWLQLVSGTSQLPAGALLIKREAGDPVGPGTLVEIP
jgi:hypothetical protein